jgi:signal transduction histidine kinase
VETLKSGKPSQATHTHLNKDNRELYYSIACYPIFENDKVVGVVEMSRDITRDINYQKTMMHQEKMISIGRLSAGVAHEINNPLTTILTTAMLIQEDLKTDDPLYGELETISKETIRCREIVTSLLDFARQSTPEKKKSNINNIVAESILLLKKQAAFNDIAITQSLDETIPFVLVDKGQIQQAAINLLINAVEATAPGGEIRVTTRRVTKPDTLEITIQDTGIGMDEKTVSRIFDPFFTNKDNGTGLGLAITHGIIEQHDGTIHVESKIGEGSTFFIRLPLKQGDDHA